MRRTFWLAMIAVSMAAVLGLAYGNVDGQSGATLTLPPTITATGTATPAPPTGTPTATHTPGPYEHVVQAGESCVGIAWRYGHRDPPVVAVIEQINGISCATLGEGVTLQIPRPTPTITPVGLDLTQTAVATSAPPMVTLDAGPAFSVQSYEIQSDDTLSSIAIQFDSSLRQLCEINPLPDGLDCTGCTWQSANCCCPRPPLMVPGKVINVPAPPPTPTVTPTFTGSETPTLTPTHRAPQIVYPPAGASVAGPVRLAWTTIGELADGEYYLVTLRDETTGAEFGEATRQLSLDIPEAYLPDDGQAHTFGWQVVVVRLGGDGLFYPTSRVLPLQQFIWRGWQ